MSTTQLNFNDKFRKIPQKALLRDNLTFKEVMMIKLQVINPEYSGILAYPHKDLPVMWIQDEPVHGAQEGIVMPKGTIVSLLTNQTTITHGVPNPTSSGTIPWYIDALTGDTVVTPVDDTYYGYQEGVTALMVPANGGAQSAIPYSSLETDLGLWTKSTDSAFTIAANIPMGIVMENIYQDIRGAYLNLQTHDAYTTCIEGRLDVPFVDTSKITEFGTDADIAAVTDSAYAALWRKWQFFAFNGTAGAARSGAFVKSDLYGKFALESGATNATKSIQTVGKVISYDCRFPKELSGTIQNYPGETLLGTATAGVPADLYVFAKTTLLKLGAEATPAAILHRIQDGAFGYAKIQILKG